MFERLKILTLLQLSNKSKLYGRNSKRIYAHIALQALVVVIITIAVAFVLYFMKSIISIPTNEYFMIFILILTQLMSIIAAISSLSVDVYQSKDNQILFSLPVENDEIFISKLIVYYINEFLRNLYFLLPFLVAFGYINSMPWYYYFNIIPIFILLPFIAVFFAAFISIFLTWIRNFLKRHNIISFIFSLIIIAALFYLTYVLVNMINTPIRLVQMYNSFIISLTHFMQTVSNYGLIYTLIGKLLYGEHMLLYYGIVIATGAVLLVLNYFVSKPIFFALTSKTSENVVLKEHHVHEQKASGLFWTFIRKEWIIAKRSLNEVMSNYAILLSLPFFMYVLNYIYLNINRSSLGNQFVLIFNVLVTLIIVTGANTQSATAISTEGYEFVLLKTAPSNTSRVAWAKMAFNFVLTTFFILLSFILFSIVITHSNVLYPYLDVKSIWLLFGFVVLVNASHILWSFQIDLLSPKLSDYAATGSLSNNSNIGKSLSRGLLMTLAFTAVSAVLFIFMQSISWYVLFGLAIIWLVYRLISFNVYLKAYFDDIEY